MAGIAGVGPSGQAAWAPSLVTIATLRRNVRCTARRPRRSHDGHGGKSASTAENARARARAGRRRREGTEDASQARRGQQMTTTSDTPMDDTQLADEAAPLDALLVDAALGPLRRFAPNASTVRFAARLARQPLTVGRRAGSLATEFGRIAVGTSVVAPAKRDRRFADPAWGE